MEETPNEQKTLRPSSSEHTSNTPLFLTFTTVPQDVTEALLLAASDLAAVVEAGGRYDDVFAPPLTPQQLQQQQMLEDHLRELVRVSLQVDTLLKLFATITACSPGRNIIPAALKPKLCFRPPIDPTRQAAAAAAGQYASAEAGELHQEWDSSKSSSQTATRCTSATTGRPAAAGGVAPAASRVGGAATLAEGCRSAIPAGATPPARFASDITGEASQSHETKGTSNNGSRKTPRTFPLGNSGSGASGASVNVAAISEPRTGSSSSAALKNPSSSEVAKMCEQRRSFSRCTEQKEDVVTDTQQTATKEEKAATEIRRRENRESDIITEEKETPMETTTREEALQKECLCDCFSNIVRFCYREQFTLAETSTLLGIMKEVFLRAVLENQTALVSFKNFKRLLLKYSVQRPPLSIRVFSPYTLKSANSFILNSFYRHYQLYVQCFIPEVHTVIMQQPVPVTTIGRLKLASCSPVVAASPRLISAASRHQRNLDIEGIGRNTAAGDPLSLSRNESSQLDAFLSLLPDNENGAGSIK